MFTARKPVGSGNESAPSVEYVNYGFNKQSPYVNTAYSNSSSTQEGELSPNSSIQGSDIEYVPESPSGSLDLRRKDSVASLTRQMSIQSAVPSVMQPIPRKTNDHFDQPYEPSTNSSSFDSVFNISKHRTDSPISFAESINSNKYIDDRHLGSHFNHYQYPHHPQAHSQVPHPSPINTQLQNYASSPVSASPQSPFPNATVEPQFKDPEIDHQIANEEGEGEVDGVDLSNIGQVSSYVLRQRTDAGETHISKLPAVLPVGIKSKQNKMIEIKPEFVRKVMDIRYTHLPKRMLASEIDDEDAEEEEVKIHPSMSQTSNQTEEFRSESPESFMEQQRIKLFVANPDDN